MLKVICFVIILKSDMVAPELVKGLVQKYFSQSRLKLCFVDAFVYDLCWLFGNFLALLLCFGSHTGLSSSVFFS